MGLYFLLPSKSHTLLSFPIVCRSRQQKWVPDIEEASRLRIRIKAKMDVKESKKKKAEKQAKAVYTEIDGSDEDTVGEEEQGFTDVEDDDGDHPSDEEEEENETGE